MNRQFNYRQMVQRIHPYAAVVQTNKVQQRSTTYQQVQKTETITTCIQEKTVKMPITFRGPVFSYLLYNQAQFPDLVQLLSYCQSLGINNEQELEYYYNFIFEDEDRQRVLFEKFERVIGIKQQIVQIMENYKQLVSDLSSRHHNINDSIDSYLQIMTTVALYTKIVFDLSNLLQIPQSVKLPFNVFTAESLIKFGQTVKFQLSMVDFEDLQQFNQPNGRLARYLHCELADHIERLQYKLETQQLSFQALSQSLVGKKHVFPLLQLSSDQVVLTDQTFFVADQQMPDQFAEMRRSLRPYAAASQLGQALEFSASPILFRKTDPQQMQNQCIIEQKDICDAQRTQLYENQTFSRVSPATRTSRLMYRYFTQQQVNVGEQMKARRSQMRTSQSYLEALKLETLKLEAALAEEKERKLKAQMEVSLNPYQGENLQNDQTKTDSKQSLPSLEISNQQCMRVEVDHVSRPAAIHYEYDKDDTSKEVSQLEVQVDQENKLISLTENKDKQPEADNLHTDILNTSVESEKFDSSDFDEQGCDMTKDVTHLLDQPVNQSGTNAEIVASYVVASDQQEQNIGKRQRSDIGAAEDNEKSASDREAEEKLEVEQPEQKFIEETAKVVAPELAGQYDADDNFQNDVDESEDIKTDDVEFEDQGSKSTTQQNQQNIEPVADVEAKNLDDTYQSVLGDEVPNFNDKAPVITENEDDFEEEASAEKWENAEEEGFEDTKDEKRSFNSEAKLELNCAQDKAENRQENTDKFGTQGGASEEKKDVQVWDSEPAMKQERIEEQFEKEKDQYQETGQSDVSNDFEDQPETDNLNEHKQEEVAPHNTEEISLEQEKQPVTQFGNVEKLKKDKATFNTCEENYESEVTEVKIHQEIMDQAEQEQHLNQDDEFFAQQNPNKPLLSQFQVKDQIDSQTVYQHTKEFQNETLLNEQEKQLDFQINDQSDIQNEIAKRTPSQFEEDHKEPQNESQLSDNEKQYLVVSASQTKIIQKQIEQPISGSSQHVTLISCNIDSHKETVQQQNIVFPNDQSQEVQQIEYETNQQQDQNYQKQLTQQEMIGLETKVYIDEPILQSYQSDILNVHQNSLTDEQKSISLQDTNVSANNPQNLNKTIAEENVESNQDQQQVVKLQSEENHNKNEDTKINADQEIIDHQEELYEQEYETTFESDDQLAGNPVQDLAVQELASLNLNELTVQAEVDGVQTVLQEEGNLQADQQLSEHMVEIQGAVVQDDKLAQQEPDQADYFDSINKMVIKQEVTEVVAETQVFKAEEAASQVQPKQEEPADIMDYFGTFANKQEEKDGENSSKVEPKPLTETVNDEVNLDALDVADQALKAKTLKQDQKLHENEEVDEYYYEEEYEDEIENE